MSRDLMGQLKIQNDRGCVGTETIHISSLKLIHDTLLCYQVFAFEITLCALVKEASKIVRRNLYTLELFL